MSRGRPLAGALALLTLLAPAEAAAHVSLAGSNPADGERVPRLPAEIALEFEQPPMAVGATVLVVDSDLEDQVVGEHRLDGRRLVARLARPEDPPSEADPANYQVRWRVVSRDGDVISGSNDFSVGDSTLAAEVPLGGDATPTSPVTDVGPTAEAESETAAGSSSGPWGPGLLSAPLGAALALGGFTGAARIRAARRRRATSDHSSRQTHEKHDDTDPELEETR